MIFREIEFGSDDFRRECELRHAVLRAPLGLSLYNEDLEPERQQIHFGLFGDDEELLACVIAAPLSPTKIRIRQMAVGREHQGKGCGRRIIQEMENLLARRGFVHLTMHARMTAVGFYTKLGYTRMGPEFREMGIPHVSMEKRLQSGNDGDRNLFVPG